MTSVQVHSMTAFKLHSKGMHRKHVLSVICVYSAPLHLTATEGKGLWIMVLVS